MVNVVLQSVNVEELAILALTALFALTFFGPESLKLRRGGVTLTQSVTRKSRQSRRNGNIEEPVQKSQQMSLAPSDGSGEEPVKKSSQERLGDGSRLGEASIFSSGDPIKDSLVDLIRSFQKSRKEEGHAWETFCANQENNIRDPARYPVDVLQQFVKELCSSEECSSHPCKAVKQSHGPSAPSDGSGEEAVTKSFGERWRDGQLRGEALIVSSCVPIKGSLADLITSLRKSGKEEGHAWETFCANQKNSIRDPARYPVHVLEQFLKELCSSEKCSSHLWKAVKQSHGPSAPSDGSGEEPVTKFSNRQRWKDRKLRGKALIVSSGGLIKDSLADLIRSLQKSGKEEGHAWETFCANQKENNRDPVHYPVDVLQQFVADHCSFEKRISYLEKAVKQSHCPSPAQAMAPSIIKLKGQHCIKCC